MRSIWSFLAVAAARSVTLNEIVEVYTGDKNHWFNHVHLWTEDVSATFEWFERHLGRCSPTVRGDVAPPNQVAAGATRFASTASASS